MAGSKRGQAACHGLHHREPEAFVERSAEHATRIGNVAVQLPVLYAFGLGPDPSEVHVQAVLLDEVVHLLDLLHFLPVLRLRRVDLSSNYHQVGQLPQSLVLPVELHQPGEVLDSVEAGHCEENGFALVYDTTVCHPTCNHMSIHMFWARLHHNLKRQNNYILGLSNLHMLRCLSRVVEELFDGLLQSCQAALFLGERVVNVHASSG